MKPPEHAARPGLAALIALLSSAAVVADEGLRPLELEGGPFVRYSGAGRVAVSWRLDAPGPASVAYGDGTDLGNVIRSPSRGYAHSVELPALEPQGDYHFRILARKADGSRQATKVYSLDASSDLPAEIRPAPRPQEPDDVLMARAARRIVDLTGITRGYCLDIGCETGALVLEMAARTRLRVIALVDDAAQARTARARLDEAGLYGVRASVHTKGPGALPYTDRFANLIISERAVRSGALSGMTIEEMARLLRPHGGTICIGAPDDSTPGGGKLTREALARWQGTGAGLEWSVTTEQGVWATGRRGPPPGGGEWSHLYADPGNSASSGDLLEGALRLQWFGRPGPRNLVDRHHRAIGPLFKDGRVFILGNERVLALDAYNGTLLWDVGVPGSRRVAAARDCGHFAAGRDRVYLAAETHCVALDAATGEPREVFSAPRREDGTRPWWGYVAALGEHLFGSAQKKGASLSGHSRETLYRGPYFDARPVATSERLFSLERSSGAEVWRYHRRGGSAIINSTIAIDSGRVSCVESRNPEALESGEGRVPLETLLAEGHAWLVTLDRHTGKLLWEREVDLASIRHVLHLVSARGKLLLSGSRNDAGHPRYDLHAFDAATGKPLWSQHYLRADKGVDGDHGEQDQHPVVAGDTVYSRPFAYNLHTGEKLPFRLDRGGHGCGTLTGSEYYLYGRGGNPRRYPTGGDGSVNEPLTRATRPGCWVHIIPAGGMVLIPEGSSGCTCGFPLQTSLGLIPEAP